MIDPKKTYRTRDGREVRIYAVDGCGEFCIHGAIKYTDGWVGLMWDRNGAACPGRMMNDDLIEVRPRIQREVWVNVYPDSLIIFDDKQHADEYGPAYPNQSRIACVKLVIDCEEGHGLD